MYVQHCWGGGAGSPDPLLRNDRKHIIPILQMDRVIYYVLIKLVILQRCHCRTGSWAGSSARSFVSSHSTSTSLMKLDRNLAALHAPNRAGKHGMSDLELCASLVHLAFTVVPPIPTRFRCASKANAHSARTYPIEAMRNLPSQYGTYN